eukprot:3851490-Amphidinium_carterae.1
MDVSVACAHPGMSMQRTLYVSFVCSSCLWPIAFLLSYCPTSYFPTSALHGIYLILNGMIQFECISWQHNQVNRCPRVAQESKDVQQFISLISGHSCMLHRCLVTRLLRSTASPGLPIRPC